MNPRNHALTDAERARIDEVDRLVAIGSRGTRALLGSLSERSWTVRRAVVAALASLGDDAVAPLCAWLRDVRSDEAAIAAAVDALVASIGTTVTEQVLGLIDAVSPAVVADAAQILGRRKTVAAVPVLAKLLEHPDDNVAVAAIDALGTIGGAVAVEALIAVIASKRFFRTYPAIQVVARTGDPRIVPALAALLSDDTYRFEVVRALGRTGLVQAIAPIVSLLATPGDSVVRLVAVALADLVQRAELSGAGPHVSAALRTALAPSIGRLAKTLRGAEPAEATAIATLLGRAGDATVLPTIATMLDDSGTADAAADALQHLGRAAGAAMTTALATGDAARRAAILPLIDQPQAAPAVRPLLDDEDPEVRARASEALARLRDVASVPALFEALGDENPRVAHAAVAAILTLGSDDTEAHVLRAMSSPRASVRRHAIRLLGVFGYRSGLEPLRQAIGDADRRNAELAIVALGAVDDPRVDDELAALASSRDDVLRAAVMRAAALRHSEAMVAMLSHGLADGSAWVRYYAAQGLGRLVASDAPNAAELLVEHLQDPAPLVRVAVIESLSRIGSPYAWDAVRTAARSADPDERRAGLVGVGIQAGEGAFEILSEAAGSPDLSTRLVALSALARLADPRALARLGSAIADPAAEVRDAALSLLVERDDAGAAEILAEHASAAELEHPVQLALSRPSRHRLMATVARLTDADARTAPILVAALARMPFPAATDALFEALAAPSSHTRAAAASALVATQGDAARSAIEVLASSDPDPEVRAISAAALATT